MASPRAAAVAEPDAEKRMATETHAAIRELTRRRKQGSAADARVLGGRAALERLLTEDLPDRELRVRKITDLDELGGHISRVADRAKHEFLSLHSSAAPTREMLQGSAAVDLRMLDRGVHLRVVYPTSFASIDYVRSYITEQAQHGATYRFADAVPYRIIVADGTHAIVPIVADKKALGAIVTSEPVLVRPLRHLAHSMLRRGVDHDAIDPANPHNGPSEMELKVIRVMALGLTDDVAAKRLAVSERTFRRYVSSVMERLQAVSRFQAGVRAVERGWL